MFRRLRLAMLAAACATPLCAADLAFVVGNENYDRIDDLRRGDDVVDAARGLGRQGVEVISRRDAGHEETLAALAQFVQQASEADKLLVVLSGHFLSSATDTYLLPVETDLPSLTRLPSRALPVSTVLAVLGEAPGRSVLVLATEPMQRDFGRYLQAGVDDPALPQGVTLIRATPRAAERVVRDVLAEPGRSLQRGVEAIDGARISGFLSDRYAFVEAGRAASPIALEAEAWDEARRTDTVRGYERFLDRYPRGMNAVEARLRINELLASPGRLAELEERALGLTREERQQVQRDLVLLGFDTRGIDGIFGPGTRGAIRAWQSAGGLEATGYLDAAQVNELGRDAVARSRELDRQAEERRVRQERDDRAFWRETGDRGTEDGYRRYLDRYPDGAFSDIARDRLASTERRRATPADLAAWRLASNTGTADAFERYIDRFPEGAFVRAARDALGDLDVERERSAEREAALAAERALGLNPLTARLVEQRLDALGLNPGTVDGAFDESTRRAIRRYQDARELPGTGFLTQPTVVQLLADSVRQLIER
ncbi:peptidoglycan-binding protein [Roseitranquillus sediminis]|uniref:peptidoglycan-binding protein n=1 Tax=Roseitranquillus sediminis TaxID=2809051 RepID=UPI001D0C39DF|nr:peptidoglycan-binding protein [Roseitranquillus sediminis]MBM9596086.1 peptidoglycan-binding protein [Roseitranquillus sediminis]